MLDLGAEVNRVKWVLVLVLVVMVPAPVGSDSSQTSSSLRFPLHTSHTSPVTGAVTLSADPPLKPGLIGVQFKLDGYVLEALVPAPPYRVLWSAASTTNGEHTVAAEARYASGVVIEAAPLTFTVANPETFNRVYYVDAIAGNDSVDGLHPGTAWKTITKANSSVMAGDTVLLRGTFPGQYIRPTVPGTAAKPITFKSYPGETAVLVSGRYGAAVWLPSLSYVIVEGIAIRQVGSDAVPITSGSHHVVLRRCDLRDGPAIKITSANDNVIEFNTIADVGREAANAGDAIWVANGSSRNRILYNTLRNAGHALIGIGGDRAGDADVLDNVVAHNDLSNPWALPLGLTWKARRTLVEHNTMHDGGTSPTTRAMSRSGIQVYASENTIRYNVVSNNAWAGLELAAYTYATSITQDAIGNQIYHNVVYGNGAWGLVLAEKNGRKVRDNLIANNVFLDNGGYTYSGRVYTIGIDQYHNPTAWPVGSLEGNQIRNNVFRRRRGFAGETLVLRIRNPRHGDNLDYTLTKFEETYPEARDNLEVDPLFTDEVKHDFTLQARSPAMGRGMIIPGVPYKGSAPDIGAFPSPRSPRNSR